MRLWCRRASRSCWCSRMDGRLRSAGRSKHVGAIIEAWYPGEFGGRAIAETLFGDNNPSGRLTITFPRSVGQLPDFYNSDPSSVHKYVDDDGKPLFPFGFGLSYTSFRYGDICCSDACGGKQRRCCRVVPGDKYRRKRRHGGASALCAPGGRQRGDSGSFSGRASPEIHLKPHESRTVTMHLHQKSA